MLSDVHLQIEKREGEKRGKAEEQSLQREEGNQIDRVFTDIKDSEI